MEPTNEDRVVSGALRYALEVTLIAKPGNSTDKDRNYAILRTELQKLMGFFYTWIAPTLLLENMSKEDDSTNSEDGCEQ